MHRIDTEVLILRNSKSREPRNDSDLDSLTPANVNALEYWTKELKVCPVSIQMETVGRIKGHPDINIPLHSIL